LPYATVFADVKFDEFRLSSINRSADWIKTEYNNQNSPARFPRFGNEQNLGAAAVAPTFSPAPGSYTSLRR